MKEKIFGEAKEAAPESESLPSSLPVVSRNRLPVEEVVLLDPVVLWLPLEPVVALLGRSSSTEPSISTVVVMPAVSEVTTMSESLISPSCQAEITGELRVPSTITETVTSALSGGLRK